MKINIVNVLIEKVATRVLSSIEKKSEELSFDDGIKVFDKVRVDIKNKEIYRGMLRRQAFLSILKGI